MTSSRVTYRLRLDIPGGTERDVQVSAPPSATGAAILAAIQDFLRLPAEMRSAHCERTGAELDSMPWGSLGLRHGDRLVLRQRPPEAASVPRTVELAIVEPGKPERRVRLPEGRHTIGRDPARASVVIADPTVSGIHLVLVAIHGVARIEALATRNGTRVSGAVVPPGEVRPVASGASIRIGSTRLRIIGVGSPGAAAASADGAVLFNRPPRLVQPIEPVVVTIGAPPSDPPKGRIPVASALIPLVITAAIFLLAPGQNPVFLAFALLSPAVLVASYWEDRRHGGAEQRRLVERFRASVTEALKTVTTADVRERSVRVTQAPGPDAVMARAMRGSPGLWERRDSDADFLRLRVGVAGVPSSNRVEVEPGGSEALRAWAAQQIGGTGSLADAPITLDLGRVGSVGLAGPREGVTALGGWLALQVAALHSPHEVALCAIVPASDGERWRWLKWLPHVSAAATALRCSPVADERSADRLLAELRRVRSERAARDDRIGASASVERPWIVVVIDGRVPLDRPAVSSLLSAGLSAGIAIVWLGDRPDALPGDCRTVVEWGAGRQSVMAGPDGRIPEIQVDAIGRTELLDAAIALAPLVDVSAEQAATAVPTEVDLLAALAAPAGSVPAWMRERWDGSQASLAAPIGVDARGPLLLDLERHGPHGLVAGTSGAGKSETLQSMVAGMAAFHPPSRVTFLLIDYKGGSAFRECRDLPHTVGYVTDLDAALTARALTSLNAELRRRERLLNEAAAKDLRTYRELVPDSVLPSLVIVVDEYATLHEEMPDFVAGLVDVAQRGRALGVHLVLGTQSPGGIVGQAIRANIGFRIAMRTVDSGESSDVIGSDAAARISPDTPGRAYLRFGNGDLVLFQSAFAGARSTSATSDAIVVEDFRLVADGQPLAQAGPADGATNLAEIAEAAHVVWDERQQPTPHRPWLPALPPFLPLASLERPGHGIAFGLVDEPDRQQQGAAVLDLDAHGGLLVYGAPGSGKTTLLRTVTTALCDAHRPEDLALHALDFGSGGLRVLEALPHVGSVIAGDDVERAARLLRLVRREIARRRASPVGEGRREAAVTQAVAGGPARLVLVIDGYEGFISAFEPIAFGEWVDALPRLAAEGRSLGVHLLISASRRASTPGPLVAALERRVILRQSEADEYASFGLRVSTRQKLDLPPGRGFLEGGLQVQVATAGRAPGEEADAIRATAETISAATSVRTPPVGVLPRAVARGSLGRASEPYLIGVADDDLRAVGLDMGDGHVVIAGSHRSGRTTALATLAASIKSAGPDLPVHLLACRDAQVRVAAPWDVAVTGPEACAEYLAGRRWEAAVASSGQLVLMVDDVEELHEQFGDPGLVLAARRRPPPGIWFVVAGQTDEIRGIYGEWLPRIRKGGHGILLDPDVEDGDLLGVRLPRHTTSPRSTGRGYLVRRGSAELIQVALPA